MVMEANSLFSQSLLHLQKLSWDIQSNNTLCFNTSPQMIGDQSEQPVFRFYTN